MVLGHFPSFPFLCVLPKKTLKNYVSDETIWKNSSIFRKLKKVKYPNLVNKGPTKPSGFYSAAVQRVIFWEWFFTDHWSSFLSPLWSRLKGLSNWLEMGQSDQLDTNEISGLLVSSKVINLPFLWVYLWPPANTH